MKSNSLIASVSGLWESLARFCADKVAGHGAQYDAFAIFGIINFIMPYFMFPQEVGHHLSILYFRSVASMLCFLLLTRNSWPAFLQGYLPLYWHLTLLFCMPFLSTYLLLDNHAATSWLMNMVLSLLLLVLLVDWFSFTIILLLGVILGATFQLMHDGYFLIDQDWSNLALGLYLYLFAIVIGVVFSRNKEKIEREKLDVMSTMSGAIAHEMRTPLASIAVGVSGIREHLPKLIKGYEEAQAADLPLDRIEPMHLESLRNIPDRLENITSGAQTIIDMLLVKLKNQPLLRQRSFSSIESTVLQALADYPMTAAERKLIHFDLEHSFEFCGNSTLMIHVIFNLLKNALHYIKSSGKGEIYIWTKKEEFMNCLHFKDTGSGISIDDLPYIFDRFYTKTKHGAGLGLAFCQLVMKSFGGRIRCISVDKEFTEFILSFPHTEQQARN